RAGNAEASWNQKLLGQNVSRAIQRAATTRMLLVVFEIIAVVKRNLLTRLDRAIRDDPDTALVRFRVAVGRATVVDEPGGVPIDLAIQIKFLVRSEERR